MRRLLVIVWLLLAAGPAAAVSTYKGLQPGKSTRSDVDATLGRPVRAVNATTAEYATGDGGSILVEFRAGNIVDRIERRFARPVSRAALVRSLGLSNEPEEKRTDRDGKLVEYFGGVKSLALTYAAAEPASGVLSVGYYSMELYEHGLEQSRNPTVQFDPTSCRDLYTWAQTERDVAKRSKNVSRHQAVLEIQIMAQRGDCLKARELFSGYQKSFH